MEPTSVATKRAEVTVGPWITTHADEPTSPSSVPPVPVEPHARSEMANRALNVVVALAAIVIVSPIMLFAALLVRLTSRGPILYRQVRVGIDQRFRGDRRSSGRGNDRRARNLGGRVFTIYKFRTMYVDAESRCGAVWATRGDPRVTPVGRIMRACRIDELPQLFNVLEGTMNIVGPRPERPSIFARLSENIEEYRIRQRARPGITGLAQINHTYDASIEDVRTKVRYDLEYLSRQSVAEDVKIMARTVPVMLLRKGGW